MKETLIKLKVHPDSKESRVLCRSKDSYELWVRSLAEDGLANREALMLLAKALHKNYECLHIVKGSHMPHKIVKMIDRD